MNKVQIKNSRIIKNIEGNLIKIISKNDFSKKWNFGEIYISEIKKNIIKGWHYHKYQTSTLFVIKGIVKIVIFKNKVFKSYKLNPKKMKIIIIPPKTWYSFKGLEKNNSLINLSNKIYNPKNSMKKALDQLGFKW